MNKWDTKENDERKWETRCQTDCLDPFVCVRDVRSGGSKSTRVRVKLGFGSIPSVPHKSWPQC